MNRKAKIVMFSAVLTAMLLMIPMAQAITVWYDNFNDNYISSPPWTVLKNHPSVIVEESDYVLKIGIPQTLEDWRSGAMKLQNFVYYDYGTIVWVNVVYWAGIPGVTDGPRVLELVLSNEVYSPMSSHRRVTIFMELWRVWGPDWWGIMTRVTSEHQVGENKINNGVTYYGSGGSWQTDYGNSIESGYPISFGIQRVWDSYHGCDRINFYFYNWRDHQSWSVGYTLCNFNSWFPNSKPYTIFGAYNHGLINCGFAFFDDFVISDY